MDSALTTVGLPLALGIIMFGLGLSLTPGRLPPGRPAHPSAVVVALACQLLLLPLVCFGLVKAARPAAAARGRHDAARGLTGGTSANLFSHLFRGDVALNVTLTAVNSVIAIVSLPLITNLAISHYDLDDSVSLQFGKVVEVFAIVLVPVAIGMLVRPRAAAFAAAHGPAGADRVRGDPRRPGARHPRRPGRERRRLPRRRRRRRRRLLRDHPRRRVRRAAGGSASARSRRSPRRWRSASTTARSRSTSRSRCSTTTEISVPAAVYSIVMFVFAALWGMFLSRRLKPAATQPA